MSNLSHKVWLCRTSDGRNDVVYPRSCRIKNPSPYGYVYWSCSFMGAGYQNISSHTIYIGYEIQERNTNSVIPCFEIEYDNNKFLYMEDRDALQSM